MIKILSERSIVIRIENEIEKLVAPLLIERGDVVEMEIIRNIFSKKEKKILDRKQVFAKIRIEKIDLNKLRLIGKIEDVEDERVSKGFHGENISLNKEIFILKKTDLKTDIREIIEKINSFEIKRNVDFNELIFKYDNKIITEFEKIEENLEYGLVEKLFVCKDEFYKMLENIKKAIRKNTKIIIVDDRYFCEKTKLMAILRFNF